MDASFLYSSFNRPLPPLFLLPSIDALLFPPPHLIFLATRIDLAYHIPLITAAFTFLRYVAPLPPALRLFIDKEFRRFDEGRFISELYPPSSPMESSSSPSPARREAS